MIFETTPSQTVGPYFAIGLPFDAGPFVVPEGTPGAIHIRGTIYDGAGAPIPDYLIETWQADPDGPLRRHARPRRRLRVPRLPRLRPRRPGGRRRELSTSSRSSPDAVPGLGEELQAPHIDVSVFARGMLHRVVTRIYFADESEANAADPVLARVPADRWRTLLAQPTADGYAIDFRFQGPDETVFFDV